MTGEPPAIIEPFVTRTEFDALRADVDSLHDKLDHLIEICELNSKALEWLVKEEKHDKEEASHG